ncbi:dihydrofolate reductase family protein, partial [Microcoleus sp. HI-ES]|nr:dihydrofolate reductase family protein [Microcoleus sp. HI-ES]
EGKNIWLVGGALLIRDFLNQNFVNEVILSVHPLILGEGIPLFVNPINTTALQLTGCQTYSSGMVQLSYDVAT